MMSIGAGIKWGSRLRVGERVEGEENRLKGRGGLSDACSEWPAGKGEKAWSD